MEVLPIMSTLENLIENPDEWEDPNDQERKTRKYKAKITVRPIFFLRCFDYLQEYLFQVWHNSIYFNLLVINICFSGKNANFQ